MIEARDGRRSLVRTFEAICRGGPLARSALRAALGASPSTITLSVQTLRERGLIVETETGGPTGGRRARIIDLAPTLGGVLAIDIGGINLRVAAANLRAQIVAKTVVRTPASPHPEQLEQALSAALRQIRGSLIGPVRAIAVAFAGVVDPVTGVIYGVENVPGWRTRELQRLLASFEAPVLIENEANLAAFGEQRTGGAQDAQSALFIALGAGIGAGLIMNGELFRGFSGAAGEIGYLRTALNQPSATLEQEAGAEAIVRKYREHGGTDAVASAEAVFSRAKSGDAAAVDAVSEVVDHLTLGIANTIVVFNP